MTNLPALNANANLAKRRKREVRGSPRRTAHRRGVAYCKGFAGAFYFLLTLLSFDISTLDPN
jgi:hypothetical protein